MGRREIKRSLQTSDRRLAEVLARVLAYRCQQVFQEVTAMQSESIDPVRFHMLVGRILISPSRGIALRDVQLDPDKAESELALLAGLTRTLTQAGPSAGDGPSLPGGEPRLLSQVATDYLAEMEEAKKWRPKTALARRQTLDLLTEILGDVPIATVDHVSARRVKDTLRRLPANKSKIRGYAGKPLAEIVAHKASPGLSTETINKHLTTLGGFFAWAERHAYVPKNPFQGLCLPSAGKPDEARQVFTEDELKAIFGSPHFRKGASGPGYRYWLPLLGYLTGARLEEICQLSLTDVRQQAGAWVIDINDRDGRRLKNKASTRLVPIHPVLVDLGFLTYVEDLRAHGQDRLFPELSRRRDGYGATASKWFARLLKRVGVKAPGKCFHSFRHTLANSLKQSGQPEGPVAALLGHAFGGITYARYGKGYGVDALADVLREIRPADVLREVSPWKP